MRHLLWGLCIFLVLQAGSASAEPKTAAYFGILMINTSLEPISEVETARMIALEKRLADGLEASGRYKMIDTSPVHKKANLYSNLSNCNGCDTDMAAELGADVAITGEVQKTSNLILGMSIYIRDSATGNLVAGGSADMRGNTDESWFRTVDWLLKNRILKN